MRKWTWEDPNYFLFLNVDIRPKKKERKKIDTTFNICKKNYYIQKNRYIFLKDI